MLRKKWKSMFLFVLCDLLAFYIPLGCFIVFGLFRGASWDDAFVLLGCLSMASLIILPVCYVEGYWLYFLIRNLKKDLNRLFD